MKKYETPQLEEKKVEIEDIIASSNFGFGNANFGDDWLGDETTDIFQ